jgi:hypothetical protein
MRLHARVADAWHPAPPPSARPHSGHPHEGTAIALVPPARAAGQRTAIVIAGMHRSGTSLLSHLISHSGARLPAALTGPGNGNPLGHWEPGRLMALNERILRELGRSGTDFRPLPARQLETPRATAFIDRIARRVERDYGDAPLLLIKDPRICRLLPLYAAALRRLGIDLCVVLCLRHPIEVARSLAARDAMAEDAGLLLWLRHVIEAEAHSRHCARAWTSFDAVLHDPEAAIRQLARSLRLRWPAEPLQAGTGLQLIARPEQRHWAATDNDAGMDRLPLLRRVWQAARCGLRNEEAQARGLFDECRAQLEEFDRYHECREHLLDRVYASRSWRLTAPLRLLRRLAFGHAPAAR